MRLSAVPMAALLLAAAVVPATAAAQDSAAVIDTARGPLPPFVLAGVVTDTLDRPLRAAEVRAGGKVALTDSLGRFRIDSITADPTYVLIRRIGYQWAETEIERQPDALEIHIVARLEPSAVQLGTVVVNGKRLDGFLMKEGFYERQQGASGTFLDAEKLARAGYTYSGVLGSIPGVQVRVGNFGALVPTGVATQGLGRGRCAMDVFLDGTLVRWASEAGINNVIPRDQLMAVEVYPRATEVPARYRQMGRMDGNGMVCGAILLWSKPAEATAADK